MAYQLSDFANYDISVAMTAKDDAVLDEHLHGMSSQAGLTFAYWRPSKGHGRYTAVITELVLPLNGDSVLQDGHSAFLPKYLRRALAEAPAGFGVAFLHGHGGRGWPDMSDADIVAEGSRLAGPVAGRTNLPLLGLTRAADGAWSGRLWLREAANSYKRRWASSVRIVGKRLAVTHHPDEEAAGPTSSQEATLSVWGHAAQDQLVRTRVGIVGLGSVGSLVAEALSRMGLQKLTYIDFDKIEDRNLDRTTGATSDDIGLLKVDVADRNSIHNATAQKVDVRAVPHSVLKPEGIMAALDCDVIICCVDRPWPRYLLNFVAYSQLIPVIDGGIFSKVNPDGSPLVVAWRIHTVGPEHACLVCLGALRLSDVALEREGLLDDPDYIAGLSEDDRAAYSRRNVFPFSMSVAAHEVLQLVGLATGLSRIGGIGPQTYNAYPGSMQVQESPTCESECDFEALTASAADPSPNLQA